MSLELLWLLLLNYLAIGLLPVVFFRKGGLNLQWWMTALPLFLSPGVLLAGWLGYLTPIVPEPEGVAQMLRMVAVTFCALSLSLISWARGIHRIPIALWHQGKDAPESIVTEGPYAKIRHPFYLSFLLTLHASVLAFPHPLTGFLLFWGALILNETAAREEGKLKASKFGAEYTAYCKRTGRFLPRWKPTG